MKKIFSTILMITGLSLSSQVNNVKPTVIVTPAPLSPNSGTEKITCDAGNGYYVGDGCACCNITCTNGNNYQICICDNGSHYGYRVINPNNNDTKSIDIHIDVTSSVIEDLNTNLDPISRVINIQKIHNAIFNLSTEFKIEYPEYILVILPGIYEIKSDKLQTICQLK